MALILITDLDQTLVDILGHVVECHRTTLAARGDHRTHAQIRKEARYGDLHGLRTSLGIDDKWFYGPEGVIRWRPDIQDSIKEGFVREIADARTMLDHARALGYRIGVVTNGDGYETAHKLTIIGIQHRTDRVSGLADAVVHGDEVPARKPSTAPALLALERLEATQDDRVLFLGDSHHDTGCAAGLRALGWQVTSILYDHYGGTYARTVPGWEHRARTHRGVMRLLRRFAQGEGAQGGNR